MADLHPSAPHVIAPPVAGPVDSPAQPTPPDARLPAMDVLRGIAILGILLVNIASFSMPSAAYIDPYAFGDMTGANRVVHIGTHIFALGKFISIFAMLFGAGIALQFARGPRTAIHLRRMGLLLVIGLLHAYLLWYGDILFSYALLGFAFFALHRLRPGWLLGIGAGVYVLGIVMNLGLAALVLLAPPEHRVVSDPAQIAGELAAFRGGWLEQMPTRAMLSFFSQTLIFIIFTGPFAGGMMLIGMGLTKRGFFDAAWKRSTYVLVAVIGCLLGWGIALLAIFFDSGVADGGYLRGMVLLHFNTAAMPLVAIGYASAVVAVVGRRDIPILWPLAAVGRTALSCYLLTTVLCTTIFYGHGLGWFGHLDRVRQLYVVFGVWAVLLVVAPLWLTFFRMGPMEWLWRKGAYGRSRQLPMRRAMA